MSESKHTPGPWHVVTRSHGTTVTNVDDVDVAWCGADYSHRGATPHAAHAALIAAAPDLLAACEAVMAWIDNWSPSFTEDEAWPADRDAARAAIAKAKGGGNG